MNKACAYFKDHVQLLEKGASHFQLLVVLFLRLTPGSGYFVHHACPNIFLVSGTTDRE